MSTNTIFASLLSTTRLLAILMRHRADAGAEAAARRLTDALERELAELGGTMPDWPARLDTEQRITLSRAFLELLAASRVAPQVAGGPVALSRELRTAFVQDLDRGSSTPLRLYGT